MNKWLRVFLAVDLVIINLSLGYVIYLRVIDFKEREMNVVQPKISQTPDDYTDDIEEMRIQMGKLINRVGNLELTPYPSVAPAGTSGPLKTVTIQAAPTKKPISTISYINVPGTGQTRNLNWTDISGTDFYFDKADYTGLTKINWEANLKLLNGSGMGFIRLFDVTHGMGVIGSEINTSSQTDNIISSGDINIWNGNNLYRIQGKSNSSDQVVFNWGRLRITTLF